MVARINLPPHYTVGEPIEVHLLIQHPMETGFRTDLMGTLIPKNVIKRLRVTLEGHTVFQASLGTGTAANPSLQFWMRAQPGLLRLEWEDDAGAKGQAEKQVTPQ